MTHSDINLAPSVSAFSEAERWIALAELQFNAQKLNQQAAVLAAGNSKTITTLAQSDATFSKAEAESYLDLALQAINAPELIADPTCAERRAQLILRAAQAAAGLNLNKQVQTALTSILGESNNLDAATFLASQQLMHVIKAAEETTKIVETLKACLLAGQDKQEIFLISSFNYRSVEYNNGSGMQYLGIADTAYAEHSKLRKQQAPKGWKKLLTSGFELTSSDLSLVAEGYFLPWQKLLLSNLADIGYQLLIRINTYSLSVSVSVPGVAYKDP